MKIEDTATIRCDARHGGFKMLELVPISLKEANAFVEQHHRHHRPVTGHKFSVAAAPTNCIQIKDTLEKLRKDIKAAGFSLRLMRAAGDDPVIVESWMR